jgi:hypothetical protein
VERKTNRTSFYVEVKTNRTSFYVEVKTNRTSLYAEIAADITTRNSGFGNKSSAVIVAVDLKKFRIYMTNYIPSLVQIC